jgi:hypothetical protein
MRRIDFAVIGAQKCATSWLFYCLRDHPEILLPRKKDEADLFGGPRHLERGEDWFDGLYPTKSDATICGSVSVDYVYDTNVLRHLCSTFPDARLVLSLRHPIERSVSACNFLVRRGQLPLEDTSTLIGTALDDVAAGRRTIEAEIVTRSLYGRQLRAVESVGALERTMIVSFEELARNAESAIAAIYRFLGVSTPAFVPESLAARPKQSAGWSVLTRIERMAPRSRVLAKVMDLSHRGLYRFGFRSGPPPLSTAVLSKYRRLLAQDLAELRDLVQRIPASRRRCGSELETLWGLGAND